MFHYSNCSYSQSKKSSNVYLSAPSIQLLTLWPPGKLLQLNNTGYADHSVSFKYLTAMQRQFLYSFPYTHETARHDKTLPRDKRFQCGFTEGKVGFLVSFFFFFFSQIVWKICLYLNGSLTCQTESGDCQNRGVQCCKKKKGKQYNKPESTFLNEWQFCL